MKLYKTIRTKKEVAVTHSEKGVKYKKPRKRIEYTNQDVLVENPFSLIVDNLTHGHLEDRIERIAKYLAALSLGHKVEMANLIEVDDYYNRGEIISYKFED